jgi:hypothetical protein
MSTLAPFSLAVLLFAFVFLFVAGFLIWYALRRNDEVRAKFGHGKTIFELETKKRRDSSTTFEE